MSTLVKTKKKANSKRPTQRKPKGTGIPELVLKLKSRMTAKEIDDQLAKQRVNDYLFG
jgi:hypothetical protein